MDIPSFPRGKLTASDEGELAITMAITKTNTLIIDFGKPVAWLGLGLADVTALRIQLERYEKEMERLAT